MTTLSKKVPIFITNIWNIWSGIKKNLICRILLSYLETKIKNRLWQITLVSKKCFLGLGLNERKLKNMYYFRIEWRWETKKCNFIFVQKCKLVWAWKPKPQECIILRIKSWIPNLKLDSKLDYRRQKEWCAAFANSLSALLLLCDKSLTNADMLLAKRPKSKTPDQTIN